ncbi:MAG: DUF192 domain-containing protein [Acidimicrobiales bacterium]
MTEPDPGPIDIDPDGRRIRVLFWVAVILLGIGLAACVAEGANGPPDPFLEGLGSTFDEVAFRVQPVGDGLPSTTEFCAWQADSDAERARGLMEVTDTSLDGHDGMVFRFDADHQGGFYMRNTRIPLSIAFFDAAGAFVAALDMEPCPDDVADCPTYGPDQPYRTALEVPTGRLPTMGIGAGTRLELVGPCG